MPAQSSRSSQSNPFSDAAAVAEGGRDDILESTLPVGSNASLTLTTDGIIVSDDGFDDSRQSRLCGLLQTSERIRTISYFHILHAEYASSSLRIAYAKPRNSKPNARLRVHNLVYHVSAPATLAQSWVDRLMDYSYGAAKRNRRIKVLINPFGGVGKAHSIYDKLIAPIFEAAACSVHIETTTHRGHATTIARELDIDAYDVLACLSGDGLPYECFNGLGQKRNAVEALRKIAIAQVPCGTGNAMCWNFNGTAEPTVAALTVVKGLAAPLDLASVTQGDRRNLSFLSQSLGIVAESDLGTDDIRWMGDFRFTWGFLVRLLGKTLYPVEYAVKTEIETKDEIKAHYAREMLKRKKTTSEATSIRDKEYEHCSGLPPLKHGTINDPLPKGEASGWTELEPYPNLGNFYCGNMCWMAADTPFFPASMPNDGMLDLVSIHGDVSRLEAVKLLLAVGTGTFFEQDTVRYRKISAVRVYPKFGSTADPSSPADISTAKKERKSLMQGLLGKLSGSGGKSGFFSVDGEQFPWEPFQIELHRGLGTTLTRTPGVYQYEGSSGWKDIDVPATETNKNTSTSSSSGL